MRNDHTSWQLLTSAFTLRLIDRACETPQSQTNRATGATNPHTAHNPNELAANTSNSAPPQVPDQSSKRNSQQCRMLIGCFAPQAKSKLAHLSSAIGSQLQSKWTLLQKRFRFFQWINIMRCVFRLSTFFGSRRDGVWELEAVFMSCGSRPISCCRSKTSPVRCLAFLAMSEPLLWHEYERWRRRPVSRILLHCSQSGRWLSKFWNDTCPRTSRKCTTHEGPADGAETVSCICTGFHACSCGTLEESNKSKRRSGEATKDPRSGLNGGRNQRNGLSLGKGGTASAMTKGLGA